MSIALKLAGCALVVGASSLLGFYYAHRDEFRMGDLLAWRKAFVILNSEISYAIKPLAEAAEFVSSRAAHPPSAVFAALASSLQSRQASDVCDIWKSAVDTAQGKTFITTDDIECIYNYGATLGGADKRLQIEAIEQTINYIDGTIVILREQSEKNKKLYFSLGLLGGLLVVAALF
ncbi:MAG: stage III sporulation protein AB [Clostridiales bacterium]|nr:stage III sporulation protein AB [Clostridiales bacterium]